MLAADSNLFIRWLLEDDKAQSSAVDRLFRDAEKQSRPIWVADIVIGEVVWVLSRFYKLKARQVANLVEPILATPVLDFENRDRLIHAMELFSAHGVDYIDCYIAAAAVEKGMEGVVSFDEDFDRLPVKRKEP